jgi:hypothetical protein
MGGDNAAAGAIIGAGSGLMIGRAVGRDTETMLMGGVLGGVVGLLIGSDYDRADHRLGYGSPRYTVRPRHDGWRPATIIAIVNGQPRPVRVETLRRGPDWVLWGDFNGRGRQQMIIKNQHHLPSEMIIRDQGHAGRADWRQSRFAGNHRSDRHNDRNFDQWRRDGRRH